ncbi:MAG TPA: UDP-N-acetylmuramoyl-L-alanine--D-glutamate ligase [Candidatus Eisenbacteria bacterium]|nr:UDP-N-acetylmuramoyl-L-alanine--D-glutamate ligase [Candidatus Eisenbacteria bacterium]
METTTLPRRDVDRNPEWRGRRVVVLGMARSGRAVARLLARHGARVRGTDLRDAASLELDTQAYTALGIELRLGMFDPAALENVDLVVVSPGIPKTAPALREAARRGLKVLSELEVASLFARAPMAAVTGTNGKSTTVTLLGQLVASLRVPVAVAGNVGWPLSEAVETVPADGALVIEVSSFQLEDVESFHPRSAAILNLTPDHLDRYDSLEDYAATKVRIFARQDAADTAVLPWDDPRFRALGARLPSRVLWFGRGDLPEGIRIGHTELAWVTHGQGRPLLPLERLSLKGPHNHENFAAALCLVAGLGLDPLDSRVIDMLERATGLHHRLEPVGEVDGVAFVNDSKATNPDSLAVALRAFTKPVVLIAGGRPKSGYEGLSNLLRQHVAAVVLIGEAAPLLETAWRDTGIPMLHCGTDFEGAVRRAWREAGERGALVLLSPGCASFDMFRDYEDRGDRFRDIVTRLGART